MKKTQLHYFFITLVLGVVVLIVDVEAQQLNAFKISAEPQMTTATVMATATIELPTKGDIFVRKAGTDITVDVCVGWDFPAGTVAAPCPVVGLTANTLYTVDIISVDTQQPPKEYRGTYNFRTKPTATQNAGGGGLPPASTGATGLQPASTGATTSGGTTAQQGVPVNGFQLDVRLQNPLKVNTITEAVKFFVNTLIKIAIPFIVVFFIWAGLKFILAQGKPDKVTEAKKMFWYTIVGTLLILGAWTITNAIIGTVNSITN